MRMMSFTLNDARYQKLESIRSSSGKSRSELLRQGIDLIVALHEETLHEVTDKAKLRVVLNELLKNL